MKPPGQTANTPIDMVDFYSKHGYLNKSETNIMSDVVYFEGYHASLFKSYGKIINDYHPKWTIYTSKMGELFLIEHIIEQFENSNNNYSYGNIIIRFKK